MKFLSETLKKTGNIHHAYAFQGEKEIVLPQLMKFLEDGLEIEIKNNPDFSFQEFETFTIDDGRALQERHGRRAISGKKVFIISTRFITSEAQNALLKIFEEPSEGTHFFLIMPNTQVLIPTLRSRLVIVNQDNLEDISVKKKELRSLVKKFLSASPAERLNLVKDIVEEKDKGKAIDFVSELEVVLSEQLFQKKEKTVMNDKAGALNEVLLVKKYLHDRAPSVKLLLEHLCLSVTIH